MLKFVAAAVALLAVAGGLAFWAYGRGDDSAEAQTQLIRWVNVTVEVQAAPDLRPWPESAPAALPTASGLVISRDLGPSGPVLAISSLERRGSGVGIDAETGKIIKDATQPEDRAAIDKVLETLRVSPLDRSTAPWPYNGQLPSVAPQREGNITFIPPDPAAGISITLQHAITTGSSSTSLHVTNGRSVFGIDAATGKVYEETARILPEDREAFDRFVSAVDHAGPSR